MRKLAFLISASMLYGWNVGDTLTVPTYRYGIAVTQKPVNYVCVDSNQYYQLFYPYDKTPVLDLVKALGSRVFAVVEGGAMFVTSNYIEGSWDTYLGFHNVHRLYYLPRTPPTLTRWYLPSIGKFYIGRSHAAFLFRPIYIPGLMPEDTVTAISFSPTYEDSVILVTSTHKVFRGYATQQENSFYVEWEFEEISTELPRINDVIFVSDTIFLVATNDGIYRWDGNQYQQYLPGLTVYRIKAYPYGYAGGGYLAGTSEGLFMSDFMGLNWNSFGPFDNPIRAFTLREDTLYVGIDDVGVIRFLSGLDTLRAGIDNPAMVSIGSMKIHSLYADEDIVLLGNNLGVFYLEDEHWVHVSSIKPEKSIRDNYSWTLMDSARILLEEVFPEVQNRVVSVLYDSLGTIPQWLGNLKVFFYPFFEYFNYEIGISIEELPVQGLPVEVYGSPGIFVNISDFAFPGGRWIYLEESRRKTILSYLLGRSTLDFQTPITQKTAFYEGLGTLIAYWTYPSITPVFEEGWQYKLNAPILQEGRDHLTDPLSRESDRERVFLLNEYLYERFGKQAIVDLLSSSDTGMMNYINVVSSYGEDPGDFFGEWAIATRFDTLLLELPYRYLNLSLPHYNDVTISPGEVIHQSDFAPYKSLSWFYLSSFDPLIAFASAEIPVNAKVYFVFKSLTNSPAYMVSELPFDSTGLAMDTLTGIGTSIDSVYMVVFNNDTLGTTLYFGMLGNLPPSPRILIAESGHRSHVPLLWSKPQTSGVLSFYTYNVYRSTSQTGNFYPVALNIEAEFYDDTLVTNGQTYYYYVTANAIGVEGLPSDTISATPVQFPKPKNLFALLIGWVYLYWDPPYDTLQSGYTIYRAAPNSNVFIPIGTTTDQYFVDTVYSSQFRYYVTANYVNPDGESEPTDTVFPYRGVNEPGEDVIIPMRIGRAWTCVSNNGVPVGGDFGNGWYGFDWPNGIEHNYYIWGSYLAVGAKVNGDYYVTATHYPPTQGEWYPGEVETDIEMYSDLDIQVVMYDYADLNIRNPAGRHLGIKVTERFLNWGEEHPFLQDAKAIILSITYDREKSDIYGASDTLKDVYIGLWIDADVSGSDHSDPHLDDMVDYEGWDGDATDTDLTDEITLLPDGTYLPQPDGIPDEFIVFGDEPDEFTVNGDTLIVPRNTSYIYDGDYPHTPVPDVGENGYSTGYIGATLIYAPPSPSDSVWVENGDTLRMVLPRAHQWWDWENDPPDEHDLYRYLSGEFSSPYNIMPPSDMVFDYRFLLSAGPFNIADGDTIHVVFGIGIGEGLNGGDENRYFYPQWTHGLRHVIDALWREYYRGSQYSDPFHPSGPFEDTHWGGAVEVNEKLNQDIFAFKLLPLTPNPAPGIATIRFSVGEANTPVTLRVYDVSGRLVENLLTNAKLNPGIHSVTLKSKAYGGKLSSGVYFVRFIAGKYKSTQKLVLIHR